MESSQDTSGLKRKSSRTPTGEVPRSMPQPSLASTGSETAINYLVKPKEKLKLIDDDPGALIFRNIESFLDDYQGRLSLFASLGSFLYSVPLSSRDVI